MQRKINDGIANFSTIPIHHHEYLLPINLKSISNNIVVYIVYILIESLLKKKNSVNSFIYEAKYDSMPLSRIKTREGIK